MPYEDGTLFHGPCFAGIRRILWLDDDRLELECRLADVPRDLQGQFPARSVNPYVADALFQALLVWVRLSCGSASLPVSTANVTLYRPLEFERTYTVRSLSESGTSIVSSPTSRLGTPRGTST